MKPSLLTFLGILFIICGVIIYYNSKDMTDLILYILIANLYFLYSDYKATNEIYNK